MTYAKVDYCYYCKQGFSARISKYLKSMQKREDEVKRARLSGDKENRHILYKLQCLRNFKHNTAVIFKCW